MPLLRKAHTFFRLPADIKWLFFKALALSALVRFTLSFMSFKKVLSWLGLANHEALSPIDPQADQHCRKVARALVLCQRYTPWKTECYTLALTGKLLLHQKKIPSTLYIGFKKNNAGKFEGHAWLKVSQYTISGKLPDLDHFTVHSYFS